MHDLQGRVAVVTGAASGIGRALAERFAAEGMRVAVADVDAGALEKVAGALGAAGADVVARVTDVRDAGAVEHLADLVYDRFGAVHVLCNNAGVFAGGKLWDRPVADFEWVLGVNLYGILHGVRAFVPRMLAAGTDGHVVNTCSVAGLFGSPFTGPYTVSKFAAFALTETLAHDLAAVGSKLRVSALCPGAVATGIASSGRHRPAELAVAPTDDATLMDRVLRDTTSVGLDPVAVADAVLDAIRHETFLVLTSDRYAENLGERAAALERRELPPLAHFD